MAYISNGKIIFFVFSEILYCLFIISNPFLLKIILESINLLLCFATIPNRLAAKKDEIVWTNALFDPCSL